jgi:DNA-binding NarL/FixJ family response regulator
VEIHVALADKDYLVAQSLARLLEVERDLRVTGVYIDGQALLWGLRARRTDVVVLDPAGLSVMGIKLIRKVRAAHPELHIIVLTANRREQQLIAAVRAGVRGYLSKSASIGELINSIRTVAQGLGALGSEQTARLMDIVSQQPDGESGLTRRQQDLLTGIVQGKTNREIACELCLTEKTVKNYMHGLLSRLGAHSRTDAVVHAFQRDLVAERDWAPSEEYPETLRALPG